MNDEKITVVATESGQSMQVVVFSKATNLIKVIVGEGVHSVTCDLIPTSNGLAYAGSVMGRELVYKKAPEEVQAELGKPKSALGRSRNFIN